MIARAIATTVAARLRQFPAVALIGPRQVGKTTLARGLAEAADSAYLDLEDPADLAKLDDAPGYLRGLGRASRRERRKGRLEWSGGGDAGEASATSRGEGQNVGEAGAAEAQAADRHPDISRDS